MTLRIIANLSCAAALAAGLSACGTLGGGPGTQGIADLLKTIATDPRCGHDDSVQFMAGVLSGSAARHCPIPNAGAAAVTGTPAPVQPSAPSPA